MFSDRNGARAGAIAAVILAMALAAGCGGGDEANGPQTVAGTTGGQGTARPSRREDRGQGQSGEGAGAPASEPGSAAPRDAEGPDRGAGPAEGEGEASGEGGQGGEGGAGEADRMAAEKAIFIRSANAICARSKAMTTRAMNAYMSKRSGVAPAKRIEGALKEVYVPFLETRLAALRELEAPQGDEARVEAIWDATEAWIELAKQKGVTAKADVDRRLIQASSLAKRYGLDECRSD